MAGKALTFQEAALALMAVDPLSDARISFGWKTVNGARLPVLRLSSKSTVRYAEKAKPLGTLHGDADCSHRDLLDELVREWGWAVDRDEDRRS